MYSVVDHNRYMNTKQKLAIFTFTCGTVNTVVSNYITCAIMYAYLY